MSLTYAASVNRKVANEMYGSITQNNSNQRINRLFREWEQIIEVCKIDEINAAFCDGSISEKEVEDASLVIDVCNKYKSSVEYDLMKYKLANDALGIGLWDMVIVSSNIANPNNKLTWSQEFRHMLGFTDESDFPNSIQSWRDRLHPDDREMTLNAFAAHINDRTGATPYDIEYRLMLKNGYYRSFHAFGATLRDQDGVPLRVAGALMDITEKNQAVTKLNHRDMLLSTGTRAAEILLSAEDESSIEAALTTSLELIGKSAGVDGVHIWRNEKFEGELHFVLANEWLSERGNDKAHMTAGAKFRYGDRAGWESMFLRREYINGPYSEMSAEDQAFFSAFDIKSAVIIPLFLQDQFWGIISFIDCASERTFPQDEINILRWVSLTVASAVNRGLHAAELREAHEYTKLLLDAMPLACHLWDRNLKMFDCNEENKRLFNLTDKNIIKDSFFKFSPEYQPNGQLSSEKSAEDLKKAFDEGKNVIKWMHQLLDGTLIPTEITLVRVPYEDDYMLAAYARDLREYNKMMEEIEQSKAQLEAANNAKSDFLASMSHEMRTPLNAVIGLSGLVLEMDGLDEEAKINLEKVYNSGSTLLNIVNDILDISKIEAGKFDLILNEYDIPSLINDTITQNILRIGEKPIEFVLDVSADLFTNLYGDDLRIKQILSNLLSNAFKYTKEGTVEFGMRSEREAGSDTVWVTAWVKDTGKGIKSEDLTKLFANYSQVDAKANHKIEGTGLGLAIAKKMLEAMDGAISVESEYGKGSTFTVRFKQKFIADTTIGENVVNNLKNFRYTDNRRRKDAQFVYIKMPYAKVLVVDDIQTNLDVSKGLMKPYGMHIDCVTCGQDAINAIRSEKVKYDAIFMDHMMPEMDGVEAMQYIRELGTDYAKNIPIIALTANAIAGNEDMFISKGFQAFLSKPISIKQLDAIIRRWVRDKTKEKCLEGDAACETSANLGCGDVATVTELQKIPGLDARAGLELYAGMMDIYLPVLRSYAHNMPAVVDKLREVTAENLQDYAISVHGLKGSSAGIGAEELRAKAAELERLSKAGDLQGVLSLNGTFLREADSFIEGVKTWLAEYDHKSDKPRLAAPDPMLLTDLCQSLSDYDMSGIDRAMGILGSAVYDTNNDLVKWLEGKITESEFDDAAERISNVLSNMEVSAVGVR